MRICSSRNPSPQDVTSWAAAASLLVLPSSRPHSSCVHLTVSYFLDMACWFFVVREQQPQKPDHGVAQHVNVKKHVRAEGGQASWAGRRRAAWLLSVELPCTRVCRKPGHLNDGGIFIVIVS